MKVCRQIFLFSKYKAGALLFFILSACQQQTIESKDSVLFSLVDSKQTQIKFSNTVEETLYFNFINYSYIYNGVGVARKFVLHITTNILVRKKRIQTNIGLLGLQNKLLEASNNNDRTCLKYQR